MFTRIKEHIRGIPVETEISKHIHQASVDDFSVVCRTLFTKVAESVILRSSNELLINEHDSSYQLRLFDK